MWVRPADIFMPSQLTECKTICSLLNATEIERESERIFPNEGLEYYKLIKYIILEKAFSHLTLECNKARKKVHYRKRKKDLNISLYQFHSLHCSQCPIIGTSFHRAQCITEIGLVGVFSKCRPPHQQLDCIPHLHTWRVVELFHNSQHCSR